MNIKDRLKTVIEHKGLSLKAFSDLTEIPYRSIQNYLRGEREPNLEALAKIGIKTDVNLHWLITGKGKIFKDEIGNDQLSDKEIELLLAYKQCDEITKDKLNIAIIAIAQTI